MVAAGRVARRRGVVHLAAVRGDWCEMRVGRAQRSSIVGGEQGLERQAARWSAALGGPYRPAPPGAPPGLSPQFRRGRPHPVMVRRAAREFPRSPELRPTSTQTRARLAGKTTKEIQRFHENNDGSQNSLLRPGVRVDRDERADLGRISRSRRRLARHRGGWGAVETRLPTLC